MRPLDPHEIAIDMRDENNVVVHHDNVLVQLRMGELTRQALEQIETTARLLRAGRAAPSGAMIFLAEGAATPDREVREAQREVIDQMLTDERSHAVVVLEGGGLGATLMRTFARTTMPRHGRMKLAANQAEAVAWLGPRVGRAPEELVALVERARELARWEGE
jgi:hypothetical protein